MSDRMHRCMIDVWQIAGHRPQNMTEALRSLNRGSKKSPTNLECESFEPQLYTPAGSGYRVHR